jgi:hypothetical protein
MATLCELIASIDQMAPEDVICAKREWRPDYEAKLVRLTDDSRIPDEAKLLGYEYFLEADVIRQVLEEFHDRADASLEEKCQRVIHYAVYDA